MKEAKKYALDRKERIFKQLNNFSKDEFIVLKAHLLSEEMLDNMIVKNLKRPQFYYDSQLRFSTKVNMLAALCDDPLINKALKPLEALNSLRNELAHNLNSPKLEKKIHKFCDIVFLNPENKPIEKNLGQSIFYLMAHLSVCELIVLHDNLTESERLEILESLKS